MLVLLGILAVLLRVRRTPTQTDMTRSLEALGRQLEAIGSSIGVGREGTRHGGRRIGESLDLGEVLRATLAAASVVGSVDGALVRIARPDGTTESSAAGLVRADAAPVSGPPDGSPYTAGWFSWDVAGSEGLRSGLSVPLAHGSLSVFSRLRNAFDADAARGLRAVAEDAEPAIANALEHRRVLEEAATDPLTGFGSASAFRQALPQAINTARRHGRRLCLIQIDLDNFGRINKSYSLARGNDVLAELGVRVLATKRGTDSIFRNSGGADEFFLLLPETSLDEAKQSYRRLCREVSAEPFEEVGKVTMASGLVELHADDTPSTLLDRVGKLQQESKRSGKNRLLSEDGDEWVCPY